MCTERGIERDGSRQQERRDVLMLEVARDHECVIDGLQIAPVILQ
jgi:hypothetical protein